MSDALQQVARFIQANPQSASSLSLYALVSTLRMDKSGYMYMLRKLRELTAEQRQMAYGLMELMAAGENQGEAWDAALQLMDDSIKNG